MNNEEIFHNRKDYINDEWISIDEYTECIDNDDRVIVTFSDNCIELIGFDNIDRYANNENRLNIDRCHRSDIIQKIYTFMKYADAKAFLKHIGYILYYVDCKNTCIDTVDDVIAYYTQWFHREIWIKNQDIPPIKVQEK